MPAGIPRATCLRCGKEHEAFYAVQAHDCHVVLAERRPYWDWLILFQKWGYGVLRDPDSRKFRTFNQVISGRQMLTEHLQADLHIGPDWPMKFDYYTGPEWQEAGFPVEQIGESYPIAS